MINLAVNDISIEKINSLQTQGLSDSQIYETLKKEGFNSVEIDDAISQAKLGKPMSQDDVEEAPEPGLRPSLLNQPQTIQTEKKDNYSNFQNNEFQEDNFQNIRGNLDDVEVLIESVIEEKWKNSIQRFGNLDVWKEKIRTDVSSVKQELIRLEHRFDNIEKAILGKISQYDRNIVNIGNEMKVLEQVFQKIINPLTSNIKELSRITKELKEK